MTWRIEYRPDVIAHDIPALPKAIKTRVRKAIESKLTLDPQLFGKPLRFNYSGLRRIRVGDYRVIYLIDPKNNVVTVTAIGHRKDIYDE
ncbi:MAG: type II toxin-antitoxin system RelE/ParE family toxin [Alphaproteobacteria bacterium]|nr:type II toxin-antitoxin system RelE/ParE family toxin [Alphaproteobacteria bacterium]